MGKAFFLIVDDDPVLNRAYMRMAGRYFLESGRQIETLTAHSGPEALKITEEKRSAFPDAEWGLLSDYDMPDMTGAELIDRLDKKLGIKLVWRLVITGALDDARKAEIEAKQSFVDQKPIEKKDFESYLYTFMMSLA
ncbi:response regulator [Candidatus Uhrbacteria bacterium]|nr:response regulator [Candidatus Uhrbacteria bacterium]